MSPLRLAIPPRCLAAGIVSIGDVVKHRLQDLELETNVLRDAYTALRAQASSHRLARVSRFLFQF